MKSLFLLALPVALLAGCGTKERTMLKHEVDSLRVELNASKNAEQSLDEVGVLLDSIDASRKQLKLKMVEGSSYSDYVARLQDINAYIQVTETKLLALEAANNETSKKSTTSIRRMKADLAKNSEEIIELQKQLATARNENLALWVSVHQRDSILSTRDQVIKLRESDIVSLEKLVNDTQSDNKLQVGNLYFEQAQALELAANRTHFAPRKRKETRKEALELYRLAQSLGNTNAITKITELEKKIG